MIIVSSFLPYFYPRPLRGGRHDSSRANLGRSTISIHALCEEGDEAWAEYRMKPNNFYPRPLRGGRLRTVYRVQAQKAISIHALCEEGDPL